jgi:hypothetical protein
MSTKGLVGKTAKYGSQSPPFVLFQFNKRPAFHGRFLGALADLWTAPLDGAAKNPAPISEGSGASSEVDEKTEEFLRHATADDKPISKLNSGIQKRI